MNHLIFYLPLLVLPYERSKFVPIDTESIEAAINAAVMKIDLKFSLPYFPLLLTESKQNEKPAHSNAEAIIIFIFSSPLYIFY